MSLLDLDEASSRSPRRRTSPIAHRRRHGVSEDVDVTLVEGAVSSQEDLARIQTIRSRTRVLAALGDCAVTANVPSMRNTVPVSKLLQAVYVAGADTHAAVPTQGIPALLPQARPLHDFVKVDAHLPGCPPRPEAILTLVLDLMQGRAPKPAAVKFG
jgi:NAD-reducing hydrogenase small subunit